MKKLLLNPRILRILKNALFALALVITFIFLYIEQSFQKGSIAELRTEIELIQQDSKIEKGRFFDLRKSFSGVSGIEYGAEVLFRMKGSNTVGDELAPALAASYLRELGAVGNISISRMRNEPELIVVRGSIPGQDYPQGIIIHAKGSSYGYKELMSGSTDVALSSNPIKASEVEAFQRRGIMEMNSPQAEHVVALDGIAIIVHPENPITALTESQIRDVFSGKTQDWILLGGGNAKIELFIRNSESGTRQFFSSSVMGAIPFSSRAIELSSHQALLQKVLENKNAISFVSLPYIGKSKAIAVLSEDKVPIHPYSASVAREDYPISRRLFMYTQPRMTNFFAKEFVDYCMGEKGQQVVDKSGFVSLNIAHEQKNQAFISENLPKEYLDLVQRSEQLSINFRFEANQIRLDTRGNRDLQRLKKYIQDNKNSIKSLILIGFSDNNGQSDENLRLSLVRSDRVRSELLSIGIDLTAEQIIATGFGDAKAIAPNATESGRYKNRRVEVWIERRQAQ
jgi:phosphate transport system substrate-binding protein